MDAARFTTACVRINDVGSKHMGKVRPAIIDHLWGRAAVFGLDLADDHVKCEDHSYRDDVLMDLMGPRARPESRCILRREHRAGWLIPLPSVSMVDRRIPPTGVSKFRILVGSSDAWGPDA